MTMGTHTRHIVSINDLSNDEIETVFRVAQHYLEKLGDKNLPFRIGRGTDLASDFVLATLFYEPSTRTRLSFESAMLRLGGKTITSADPGTSSAAKGESLADTVRVLSNYADAIVIRHPKAGAARLAAEYAGVPVINGGDGSHEHPTQTLCDLFTLKKQNKNLKGLKVAISGDLKGSRTIHSFVYALARFGAFIQPLPATGMELPRHVDERLREEFQCKMIGGPKAPDDTTSIDALYVTPDQPHQPSLFSDSDLDLNFQISLSDKKFDAVYVTRFQKERWQNADLEYPKVDAKFLRSPKYATASVLHPLPRVGELDTALDSDVRAKYFQQAAYGVPIRMALIALVLGVESSGFFERFAGGFRSQNYVLYQQARGVGIECSNTNCITREDSEQQYIKNRFYLVHTKASNKFKLRCFYCESDIDHFMVAHKKNHWFSTDMSILNDATETSIRDFIFFIEEEDARKAGYHPRRGTLENKQASSGPKS